MSKVMDELRIEHGWENPAGAEGDELRATWGRLIVRVGGWPVSKLYDYDVKTVSDQIYLPLYPVAEWIVENWWALLYEVENPTNRKDPNYAVRHDLNRASGGFALPRLRFSALGERMQLHWDRANMPSKRVEFMNYGTRLVDRAQVENELTRFVSVVIERLRSEGVLETPLQKDWDAINKLDADERAFCKAAAMAGLDPFDLSEGDDEALISASERVPKSLLDDLLSIINGKAFAPALKEVDELQKLVQKAKRTSKELLKLRAELDRRPTGESIPYMIGYAHAARVRNALGLNGDKLSTTDRLVDAVHLAGTQSIVHQRFGLAEMEGFLGFHDPSSPMFVVSGKKDSPAERFKFARCLHEFLFQKDALPRLVTKADSEEQRINRSFAAELLAPGHSLKDRVSSDWIDWDEVEEIAFEYGVSSWLIGHQLKNHRIARVSDASGSYEHLEA